MAGKKFTEQAQQTSPYFEAVEASITQDTQEAQPALDVYDARNTQGKAGLKAERINMAFSPANYEFIKVMSSFETMSLTKYVNHLVEEERKRSADKYQKIKDLKESL